MPSSWSPKRTEVSPDQGDMFSGTPGRLQPDPHFPNNGEVAHGLAVSLEERNEALRSALTWLGRMASSASYREIGRKQAEGRRTPAVRHLEARYTQEELEEKMDASENAKSGVEKAMAGQLKKAFGYEELADSPLFPEITREKVEGAFLSGGASNGNQRSEPGHKEGKQEFEARFKGSNHKNARHRYRQKLTRQSAMIKKIKSGQAEST